MCMSCRCHLQFCMPSQRVHTVTSWLYVKPCNGLQSYQRQQMTPREHSQKVQHISYLRPLLGMIFCRLLPSTRHPRISFLVSYVDAFQRFPDLICTWTADLDHPNHTPSQCAFQYPNNTGLLTYLNTCELFFVESKIPHQRPTQHKLQSYRFVYGLGMFENGTIPRDICRPRWEQPIGRWTQLQMRSIIICFHSQILLRLWYNRGQDKLGM